MIFEFGSRNAEVGKKRQKTQMNLKGGSRTRRRPIEQDYAAAKDAEGGKGRMGEESACSGLMNGPFVHEESYVRLINCRRADLRP
jgi:hypothetical protein